MAIPKGLTKCEICGEYKGKVKERELNWEGYFARDEKEISDEYLSVSCLCEGIICPVCKKNRMHKPISNSYDATTNQVWHIPAFMGQAGCNECRSRNNRSG